MWGVWSGGGRGQETPRVDKRRGPGLSPWLLGDPTYPAGLASSPGASDRQPRSAQRRTLVLCPWAPSYPASVSLSSPGFPSELPLFPPSSFTLRSLLLDPPVPAGTPGFTLPLALVLVPGQLPLPPGRDRRPLPGLGSLPAPLPAAVRLYHPWLASRCSPYGELAPSGPR